MKSEEIKAEIAALEVKRDDLTSQIRAKNIAYLEAVTNELPYKEGDKVGLFRKAYDETVLPVGEGIYGWPYLSNARIKHHVWKIKKDGTQSQINWSPYEFETIEKAAL